MNSEVSEPFFCLISFLVVYRGLGTSCVGSLWGSGALTLHLTNQWAFNEEQFPTRFCEISSLGLIADQLFFVLRSFSQVHQS